MEVIIRESAESVVDLVAYLVAETIRQKPEAVLGLATGKTMEAIYARLVELYEADKVDFSGVTTFNLDEYIGLKRTDPQSYRTFMDKHLFDRVNISKKRTFLPDGSASDLDRECEEYEKRIENAGGIDLQLLGLGVIGHIGFNEPLSSLASRTRTKCLTPETRRHNATYFGSIDAVPNRAITMGVGTILDSRRCIMVVTGPLKADILSKAVEGPVTSVVSASALQMHRRCVVICDEAAATKLQHRSYYKWVFENEPEWKAVREMDEP